MKRSHVVLVRSHSACGERPGPPRDVRRGSKGYTITLNVYHGTVTGQQAKTLFDQAVARLR